VAKHAIPVIEERMKIIEDAEIKGIEPKLPVGTFNPSRRFLRSIHAYLI
jgi:hypothetical protein